MWHLVQVMVEIENGTLFVRRPGVVSGEGCHLDHVNERPCHSGKVRVEKQTSPSESKMLW